MRLAVLALMLTAASPAAAQLLPETRIDFVTTGPDHHIEGGLGLGAAMGPYLRAALTASYDLTADASQPRRLRIENQIRFLLDPIAQGRWGLSAGGGLGVRQRAYLVAAVELEGPQMQGMRPAIQFALGGGERVAFVIRRARAGRR